jgi:hypothetical protein
MAVFNKSRRKAIAPVVLGVWIFALMTSIAHACGLLDQLEHVGVRNPVPAVAAHESPGDESLPACDKFCADDIPLLTKLKAVEDSPTGSVLVLAASAAHATWLAPAESTSVVNGPDPPPAIAVNTRFVRLAL